MSKSSNDPPFPIYDRMVLSGQLTPSRASKFFEASQAFSRRPRGSLVQEHGPAAPLYDSMWLEGKDKFRDQTPVCVAISVQADSLCFLTGSGKPVTRNTISAYWLDGPVKRNRLITAYSVADDGTVGEIDEAVFPQDRAWLSTTTEDDRRYDASRAKRASGLALFAIGLMHCRNIRVEPTTYQPPRRRQTSRVRPAVEYHTIKLPGLPSAGGGSGQLTGTTKLHTARGHFKTYTEDAPLMGRHVGTYYWGWQVRGNRKNGEVISSYEVGVSA